MKQVIISVFVLTAVFLLCLSGGTRWIFITEWDTDSLILQLRFVRVLTALTVGGALSVSGMVFQSVLRNPLADPYILGISGGAAVGAAVAIVTGLSALFLYAVPLSALIAALIVLVVVILVSRGGMRGEERLLLSGVMAGVFCSSILMCLISSAAGEELQGITWWLLGDLQGAELKHLFALLIFSVLSLCFFQWKASVLNGLVHGDEYAFYLGISPARSRLCLILPAAVLTSCCVAASGIIGFCGLVIPHVVRRLCGSDHRKTLIPSFLWGGTFLMLCDLVSRSILTAEEIPVGIVTSFIGVPVFLWILNGRGKHADC